MSQYKLRLSPHSFKGRTPPAAELVLEPGYSIRTSFEGTGQHVYNNFSYTVELLGPGAEKLDVGAFYCNDFEIRCNNEKSVTKGRRVILTNGLRIFVDNFGYVRFTLVFREGQEPQTLYSALIPVYADARDRENSQIFNSMSQMADYVIDNCEPYGWEDQLPAEGVDKTPSLVRGGLKLSVKQSLEALAQLLERIVRVYQQALPFFRTGSKYRVRPEKQWVSQERAVCLGADAVHSILQRPCHLRPVRRGGMQLPGREERYIPSRVVAPAGKMDYDIYENQYVVGFLRYLLDKLDNMSRHLDTLLKPECTAENKPLSGYVDTSCFIHGSTPQRLRVLARQLADIRREISELYVAYHHLLPAVPVQVRDAPLPTAIFRSVHHYQGIYELACQWFHFGVYDFRREDMVLSFIEGHTLYEYYVLIKLLRRLEDEGFQLIQKKCHARPPMKDVPPEPKPVRPNRFAFRRGSLAAWVFYEPWIFGLEPGTVKPEKNLGLFCSTSYTANGIRSNGSHHLYHPDYVVKLQKADAPANYVILDAKLSSRSITQKNYMPGLIYKYLFALSPIRPEDKIVGLSLLYGKPLAGGEKSVTEICDQTGDHPELYRFVRLVALYPDNEAEHTDVLSKAMSLHVVVGDEE